MSQTEGSTTVTTSLLLSNLHCPSCVSHIERTLLGLDPKPVSVSPSLVTSVVTVEHDRALSAQDIRDSLENAGFDICEVTPQSSSGNQVGPSNFGYDSEIGCLDRFLDKLRPNTDPLSQKLSKQSSKHLENCELCRLEAAGKDGDSKFSQSDDDEFDDTKSMTKAMPDQPSLPLVVVDSSDSESVWQASLAIGGMTCAACVVTLTEGLEKNPWIKKVAVNLISNSATIDFAGEEHKDDLVEMIEDMGYDAVIYSIVDMKAQATEVQTVHRTVEILVDGMFCGHCPPLILAALKGFGEKLEVEKPPSLQDPIVKISYTPKVPDFTIRNIIAAISAADSSLTPTNS